MGLLCLMNFFPKVFVCLNETFGLPAMDGHQRRAQKSRTHSTVTSQHTQSHCSWANSGTSLTRKIFGNGQLSLNFCVPNFCIFFAPRPLSMKARSGGEKTEKLGTPKIRDSWPFGARYPVHAHADILADVRGQKLGSGPQNLGKQAFRCGHPRPEGADVHDPRGV